MCHEYCRTITENSDSFFNLRFKRSHSPVNALFLLVGETIGLKHTSRHRATRTAFRKEPCSSKIMMSVCKFLVFIITKNLQNHRLKNFFENAFLALKNRIKSGFFGLSVDLSLVHIVGSP